MACSACALHDSKREKKPEAVADSGRTQPTIRSACLWCCLLFISTGTLSTVAHCMCMDWPRISLLCFLIVHVCRDSRSHICQDEAAHDVGYSPALLSAQARESIVFIWIQANDYCSVPHWLLIGVVFHGCIVSQTGYVVKHFLHGIYVSVLLYCVYHVCNTQPTPHHLQE